MANKYTTKAGKHGTLYLYEIEYRDNDPASPVFTLRLWAYSREHVVERFYDSDDADWRIVRVARVQSGPRHRWAWAA